MSVVFGAASIALGSGAYLLLYWALIARTARSKDPTRNIFALTNQRYEARFLRLGIALSAAGVLLLTVSQL